MPCAALSVVGGAVGWVGATSTPFLSHRQRAPLHEIVRAWSPSGMPRAWCPPSSSDSLAGSLGSLRRSERVSSAARSEKLAAKAQCCAPKSLACARASCIHRTFSLTLRVSGLFVWYVSSKRHGRRVGEYQSLLAKLAGRPLAWKPKGFARTSMKTSTCSSRGSADADAGITCSTRSTSGWLRTKSCPLFIALRKWLELGVCASPTPLIRRGTRADGSVLGMNGA